MGDGSCRLVYRDGFVQSEWHPGGFRDRVLESKLGVMRADYPVGSEVELMVGGKWERRVVRGVASVSAVMGGIVMWFEGEGGAVLVEECGIRRVSAVKSDPTSEVV